MTPALLTQTSIRPNSSTHRRASSRTAPSSVTSVVTTSGCPPSSSHSPATSRRICSLLAASTTRVVLGEQPRGGPTDPTRGTGHAYDRTLYLPQRGSLSVPFFMHFVLPVVPAGSQI